MTDNNTKSIQTPKNLENYNLAISKGQDVLSGGGSKAEAARVIYLMIQEEDRDVIIQAFIEGASVTVKGSPTYYYNVKRQIERKQREEEKNSSTKKSKKTD